MSVRRPDAAGSRPPARSRRADLLAVPAALAVVTAGSLALWAGLSSPARLALADAPATSFSVDAVPGGAVNSTRTVAVGVDFSVQVVVDTYDGTPWVGYQVRLEYDDDILDADPGFAPASWTSPPVANTTGGSLEDFSGSGGSEVCAPSPGSDAIVGEDDTGLASYTVSCVEFVGSETTAGALIEFVFECENEGVATLEIVDDPETVLVDEFSVPLYDHDHGATITCGEEAPSNTPTFTPTSTPTATPTNTPTPAPAVTFTVNSTNDVDDGPCNVAHCSLREAIKLANTNPSKDTIAFSVGSGAISIKPGSGLPVISYPVILDGRSQPGFTLGGPPIVEIRGDGAGGGADGIVVEAGNSTVRGLIINRFDGDGLVLRNGGGNTVQTNHVGTGFCSCDLDLGNAGNGLRIENSADNLVGGTAPLEADYNSFSGNGVHGVLIIGAGSSGNELVTNVVGTNGGLTLLDVGNTGNGLRIEGAPNNLAHFNTFGGNGWSGVEIVGAGAIDNIIKINAIGTDRNGTIAIPNDAHGVYVDGAQGTLIGEAGGANLISGNAGDGVHIEGGATGTNIRGNAIGTTLTGLGAIANGGNGVEVVSSFGTTVGGNSGFGQGNLISGNTGSGVSIAGAQFTLVSGNIIGLDGTGAASLGNGSYGVEVSGTSVNIGSPLAGGRNVISGNLAGGIVHQFGEGIVIRGNYIGLNVSGTAGGFVGNLGSGISTAAEDVSGDVVGGSAPADRNVIAGNSGMGLLLIGDDYVVRGNYIGTDRTGNVEIGNGSVGLYLENSDDSQIGGAGKDEGNVIAGSDLRGIDLMDVTSTTVFGNHIGVGADGITPMGNGTDGVLVSLESFGNDVGGGLPGQGNIIANNGEDGVRVNGADAVENTVRGNAIFDNTGDAIDNVAGGNTQLTAPSVDTFSGGVLSGTACDHCTVDIYSDSGTEARLYGGSVTADVNGDWSYTGDVAGPVVRATATDSDGNTSELSAGFDVIITGLAGSSGTGDYAGDGGAATSALLNTPTGLFKHSDGVLYFADRDNNRIRTINDDAQRTINTFAGSGSPPTCPALGDGGAATSAGLCKPRDVFVDTNGDVYIADTDNCRVRKVSGGTITTVAGDGTCSYGGDYGAATSAQLNSPRGVALDAAGNIYIADTLNHRVRKVDGVTGIISTFVGTGSAGSAGDGGIAWSAQLDQPHDVYMALGNHLIIADTGNNKLRRVYLPSVRITTFAGTGVAGDSGDGGPALLAQLEGPEAIAADIDGNVYVADTQNHKIRRVSFSGAQDSEDQTIVTVAGTGMEGDSGNGGPATSATLRFPAGIAVGSLDISDTGNETVREMETQVDPTGQPTGELRATTSCVVGSAANADMLLLLLVPGMVLFRRSIRRGFMRFLTLLAASWRRLAPQRI
jgi:CSLREA domain-containing protein